ncbi:MAG: AMP-binding protein [Zoogloeaceae bacterium]|nr:AMP-binding protein [Zoogloeaceae bacterium]
MNQVRGANSGPEEALRDPEPRLPGRFAQAMALAAGREEGGVDWRAAAPDTFWPALWRQASVIGEAAPGEPVRLNFAENVLRARDDEDVLAFWGEARVQNRYDHGELYRAVAHFAAALHEQGIGPSHRVLACLPNMPEAVIALLAVASVGAVFAAIPADLDADTARARVAAWSPHLIVASDGYESAGGRVDTLARVAEWAAALPELKRVVLVPYVHGTDDPRQVRHGRLLAEFVAPFLKVTEIGFQRQACDAPAILVGEAAPGAGQKRSVIGAGELLLWGLKTLRFDADLGPNDRLACALPVGSAGWFRITAAPAAGARLLLYAGAAVVGSDSLLLDFIAVERATHVALDAQVLEALAKGAPEVRDFPDLRVILSPVALDSRRVVAVFGWEVPVVTIDPATSLAATALVG